ncbi:hypothetical protein KEM60_01060 [Austwickia sp. TVS 96-490-7B]|nr:hypothetical protein [Austwickia sp. TVS 96-490-7B]
MVRPSLSGECLQHVKDRSTGRQHVRLDKMCHRHTLHCLSDVTPLPNHADSDLHASLAPRQYFSLNESDIDKIFNQ